MPFIPNCAASRSRSSKRPTWNAPKPAEPEEEEEESRLDILDDPVQMYLRQMGKVPLLTREQEVEICKRIEEGETEARRILFGFGFTGKEHVALAEKLLSDPPRERFDRVIVDKKVESRATSSVRLAPPGQARPRPGSAARQGLRTDPARQRQAGGAQGRQGIFSA